MGFFGGIGNFLKKAAPIAIGLGTGGLGGGLLGALSVLGGGGGGAKGDLLKTLASLGLGGLGLADSIKSGKKKGRTQEQQRRLADFQFEGGRELFEGGRDIRDIARSQLLARLRRGALQAPDVGGLADTSNPFRSKFSFDTSVPALQLPGPARKAEPRPGAPTKAERGKLAPPSGGSGRGFFDRISGPVLERLDQGAPRRPSGGSGRGFFDRISGPVLERLDQGAPRRPGRGRSRSSRRGRLRRPEDDFRDDVIAGAN